MARGGRGGRGKVVVHAKPWLRRQLDERGALIFWRDVPDGRRVGLACGVDTCRNPGCNCRDASLHGIAVDDLLVQVEVPTGKGPIQAVYIPDPARAKRSWRGCGPRWTGSCSTSSSGAGSWARATIPIG